MKSRFIDTFADSPKRVRVMFRVAMVTLLTAGCYNWMIRPQTSYLYAAQQRNRMNADLVEQKEEALLSIGEFRKKINDLENQSERLNKILFEPNTVRDFFCSLETLAEKTRCRIESLTFNSDNSRPADQESQESIVQAIQASMVAIGNYDAFIRFFEQAGHYPKKVSIHELRFEPLAGGQSTLRCNAVITVYVADKTATKKQSTVQIPGDN